MAAIVTQSNAQVLQGNDADRPLASTVPLVGTIYKAVDNNNAYMLVTLAGVKTWVSLEGTVQVGLPKYFVSPPGQQPIALYGTITAAINAAVADGHGPSNPTVVLVYPGTYPETVTLQPGISVVGAESALENLIVNTAGPSSGVVITGTVGPSTAATSGTCLLANVSVDTSTFSPFFPSIGFAGTGAITFMLARVAAKAGGTANVINLLNTNTLSALQILGSTFSQIGTGSTIGGTGVFGGTLLAKDSVFSAPGAGTLAINVPGSVSWSFNGCTFTGGFTITAKPSTFVFVDQSTLTISGADAFSIGVGAALQVTRTTFNVSPGSNVFSGSGIAAFADISMSTPNNTSMATATTVQQTPIYSPRNYTFDISLSGLGPFTMPLEKDLVFVTPTAPAVLNLPDVTTVIETRVTIKTDGSNNVTVTAFGAQKIDAGPTFVLAAGATQPAVTLQADPAHSIWRIVSKF